MTVNMLDPKPLAYIVYVIALETLIEDRIMKMCNCFNQEAQERHHQHASGCVVTLGRIPNYEKWFNSARGAIMWYQLRGILDAFLKKMGMSSNYVHGSLIYNTIHFSDNQHLLQKVLIGRNLPKSYNLYNTAVVSVVKDLQFSEKMEFIML